MAITSEKKKNLKSLDKIDIKLLEKTIRALLQHIRSSDKPIEKEKVYIQVNTFQPVEKESLRRPSKVFLPHRIMHVTDACLIVKDSQQTYQDLVEQQGLDEVITKVLSIPRLKLKYKTIREKCELRDSHNLFLVDDRVLKYIPLLMGKVFEQKKIKPFPISVLQKKETLRNQVARCLHSTYLKLSAGTSHTILCGLATQTNEQLLENITTVLKCLLTNFIPKGWSAIDNVAIKTADSASLPIWTSDTNLAAHKRHIVHIQGARPLKKSELRAQKRGSSGEGKGNK
ncbi:U3 snoRNP-associated protein Cic1/Utp30 family protein [Schizosaccharomyces pombe]